MLQQSTLTFLSQLNKNNNKPWFDANRKKYEAAKTDFLQLVEKTIQVIGTFDNSIITLEPKKCIFRINRDVRFSKDKSPYKNNMGASFNKGGKKIQNAGYYLHVEPGKSFIAGGIYMPMPPELNKIRQEIDYNFIDWKTIVENKPFKKIFTNGIEGIETLQRPPKGYDENNPAITYLKMKSYIASVELKNTELTDKKMLKTIETVCKQLKPMLDFLNTAIE
ncbi:MAG: DUF2461 domain-containing protein [Ferruginibacter sp.]|nr:DUF2461 domain-containing protein [Ferruginibacter sp.]